MTERLKLKDIVTFEMYAAFHPIAAKIAVLKEMSNTVEGKRSLKEGSRLVIDAAILGIFEHECKKDAKKAVVYRTALNNLPESVQNLMAPDATPEQVRLTKEAAGQINPGGFFADMSQVTEMEWKISTQLRIDGMAVATQREGINAARHTVGERNRQQRALLGEYFKQKKEDLMNVFKRKPNGRTDLDLVAA